jgi:hypothetical protein
MGYREEVFCIGLFYTAKTVDDIIRYAGYDAPSMTRGKDCSARHN